MNARNGKIPGFESKTYHPVVRVAGFFAIIAGLWVIFSGIDLLTTVLLTLAIVVLVLMFVFNLIPRR